MNKIGYLSTLSLLAISLLIVNPASAHPGGKGFDSERPQSQGMFRDKHHRGGPLGYVKHIMRSLDLSDEQKEQIDQIVESAQPAMSETVDEMRLQRQKIHALVSAETFDREQIEVAAEAQSQLMKRMIVEGAEIKASIFEILTSDQRDQIRQKMEKRRGF